MAHQSPKRLTVTKEQLAESGRVVGLGPLQTDRMWDDLVARATVPAATGFTAAQVAWYFGAAVVLVAMGWLIALVGASYGTGALVATSLIYTALFTYGGYSLASQRELRVPGGLLYMLAVCMTPVTVSSAFDAFHWDIRGMYDIAVPMLATAAVGLAFTRVTRISFVALPALLAGWFGVIGGVELFAGPGAPNWQVISVLYGGAVAAVAFLLDGRTDEDYSFWGYGIGALAAFVGMTFADKGELVYALYAGAGVASMLVSVLLARRVFAFAGAAAVLVWIFHLSFMAFADSMLFPVVLTALGAATIYGGVLYHRHAEAIDAAILRIVPEGLRRKLPRR